jgi:hypothetical protein
MLERGNRFDPENRLSRTPFVEEVEVLDAELKARFGACAESDAVHEEAVCKHKLIIEETDFLSV